MLSKVFPLSTSVERVSKWIIDIGEFGWSAFYGWQFLLMGIMLLFVCVPLVADQRVTNSTNFKRTIFSDYFFALIIFVFIVSVRFPTIIIGMQNTDEAIWLADAKTMLQDPRPWVSIDTGTGGPLVPAFILALKVFGLPLDQGTLKLLSFTMMALSVVTLFLAGTFVIGSKLSRLFILPLTMAVAAMSGGDTIAYNSEHPATLLLCLALCLLAKLATLPPRSNLNIILLGFLLGLIPFAKLQVGPIGMFVGLCACIVVYRNYPLVQLVKLVGSALLPALFIIGWVSSYDGLSNFWMSYIRNNLGYAFETGVEAHSISEKMALFFHIMFVPEELHFFVYSIFGLIIFLTIAGLITVGRITSSQWMKLSFAVLLLAVSVYCIVAPGRAFTHYMLLSLVPLTIMAAILADSAGQGWAETFARLFPGRTNILSMSLLLIFVTAAVVYYFRSPYSNRTYYLSKANERYGGYVFHANIVAILNSYFRPGEKMAIWGWAPELWDCTDFLMGTRDAASAFQMNEGPLQQEHMNHYISDMTINQPALFVETIGPNFFGYHDKAQSGYQNYPELKELIDKNYHFEGEINDARIFVRNDYTSPPFIVEKYVKDPLAIPAFPAGLTELRRNGSFLQFGGWAVLTNDVENQKVKFVFAGKQDTLLVNTLQIANKGVADYSNNKGYLLCGFLGFVPMTKLPGGEYRVGLLVKSADKTGFSLFNQSLDTDTFQDKDKP